MYFNQKTYNPSFNRSLVSGNYYIVNIVIGIAIVLSGFYWFQQTYTPPVAIQTAEQFLKYMQTENYKAAFELTVKQGYVGTSPQALSDISLRHCLVVNAQYAYSFPPQTRGNRLRRWWNGQTL